MNRATTLAFAFLFLLGLSGCAGEYPVTTTTQGAPEAALYVVDPPMMAWLYIDGKARGDASLFDGSKGTAPITPGRHLVELRVKSKVIYRKTVFIGRGATVPITP